MEDKFGVEINVDDLVLFAVKSELRIGKITEIIEINNIVRVNYPNSYSYTRVMRPTQVAKVNDNNYALLEHMVSENTADD